MYNVMLISSIYNIRFRFVFRLWAVGTHILLHLKFIFRVIIVGLNSASSRMPRLLACNFGTNH